MAYEITILGCGSSGGVPRIGGDWGICDPNQPKNRRTRCSILVEQWQGEGEKPSEKDRTIVLIDTSPDLREQILKTDITHIDALFYTHDHADQTHGIDDLRALAYRMRKRIPTYFDEHTKIHLYQRFDYCFEMPDGRVHPAILDAQSLISSGHDSIIEGAGGPITLRALGVSHGPTPSLGFLINNEVVYTPDVHEIDDDIFEMIGSPKIWIVDALRYADHPTHANLDKAMSWIARSFTKQAILTNLHIDMDYDLLSQEIPHPHLPAYDGMVLASD